MMLAGRLSGHGRVAVAALLAACSRPVDPAQAPPGSSNSPTRIASVEASIIFTDCPKAPIANPKSIRQSMEQLVEKCTSVPNGKARFVATFEPGGQIRLAPPEGQADGTVPICVLAQGLRHRLLVVKSCHMEVQMEERSGAH